MRGLGSGSLLPQSRVLIDYLENTSSRRRLETKGSLCVHLVRETSLWAGKPAEWNAWRFYDPWYLLWRLASIRTSMCVCVCTYVYARIHTGESCFFWNRRRIISLRMLRGIRGSNISAWNWKSGDDISYYLQAAACTRGSRFGKIFRWTKKSVNDPRHEVRDAEASNDSKLPSISRRSTAEQ